MPEQVTLYLSITSLTNPYLLKFRNNYNKNSAPFGENSCHFVKKPAILPYQLL